MRQLVAVLNWDLQEKCCTQCLEIMTKHNVSTSCVPYYKDNNLENNYKESTLD